MLQLCNQALGAFDRQAPTPSSANNIKAEASRNQKVLMLT